MDVISLAIILETLNVEIVVTLCKFLPVSFFFISCIRLFKAIFAMVELTRAASVAASVTAPTVLHTMIGFSQISTKNNAISKIF